MNSASRAGFGWRTICTPVADFLDGLSRGIHRVGPSMVNDIGADGASTRGVAVEMVGSDRSAVLVRALAVTVAAPWHPLPASGVTDCEGR